MRKEDLTFNREIRVDDTSKPDVWIRFLAQSLPESGIITLQKWFGYCLDMSLDHQKALLATGDFGGIDLVIFSLSRLMSNDRCTRYASIDRMQAAFELSGMEEKSLLVVDAAKRYKRSEKPGDVAMDRLIKIVSGEPVTIHKQMQDSISRKLNIRVVIESRRDEVGARTGMAKEFLSNPELGEKILNLHFSDSEYCDRGSAIMEELPSILNWALEGLELLNRDGF